MSNTYLFAGASSKSAFATKQILQEQNQTVFGISTKEEEGNYNRFYKIGSYEFGNFPDITEALNGLVYFPGTINLKPFHRLTENDFLNDYKINALGAVAFIQKYLPNLKNSPNGSIVLISSVAANTGMPFHSSIAMAKAAIEGLTKSLAAELAPSIRVNCIAPSLTNTALGEKFLNTPEKIEASQKRNPLKKIGEPIDLANAIEFLLSEKSKWITGQVIAIDGGMNTLKL
jgi:3-oxoacyl-[acyl-carrier protein] reductase